MEESCRVCGVINPQWVVTDKIFKNGTKHKEMRCPDCQSFYKYQKQNKEDIFYFGKYKGEKVSEVMVKDEDYIKWFLKNGIPKAARALQRVVDKINNKKIGEEK